MTRNSSTHRGQGSVLRAGEGEQATFVELFSDLAMVFILSRLVAQAVDILVGAHAFSGSVALLHTLLLFLPMMRVWALTTSITARFDPRRPAVQAYVIGSVFGVLVFGISVSRTFDGLALAFALTYIIMQAGRSLAGDRPSRRSTRGT